MLYLSLAILSSALVSITMRLSDKHVKNSMPMFMANYAICIVLSIVFGLQISAESLSDGLVLPVGLGLVSGILYLAGFMLLQTNIKKNGVVLSATFMKLGVIVPTVMAVVAFHETPGILAILGIIIAIAAIIIINYNPANKKDDQNRQIHLLVILLLVGGFTDSLSNVYDKCGAESLKDLYLIFTFLAAFISSAIMKIIMKQKYTLADLGWGALIGIPNYFSARFLLLSLSKLQAVIVFPVYNIATIVLITTAGMIFFHEKLDRRKWFAMGLIIVALVLLNA